MNEEKCIGNGFVPSMLSIWNDLSIPKDDIIGNGLALSMIWTVNGEFTKDGLYRTGFFWLRRFQGFLGMEFVGPSSFLVLWWGGRSGQHPHRNKTNWNIGGFSFVLTQWNPTLPQSNQNSQLKKCSLFLVQFSDHKCNKIKTQPIFYWFKKKAQTHFRGLCWEIKIHEHSQCWFWLGVGIQEQTKKKKNKSGQ